MTRVHRLDLHIKYMVAIRDYYLEKSVQNNNTPYTTVNWRAPLYLPYVYNRCITVLYVKINMGVCVWMWVDVSGIRYLSKCHNAWTCYSVSPTRSAMAISAGNKTCCFRCKNTKIYCMYSQFKVFFLNNNLYFWLLRVFSFFFFANKRRLYYFVFFHLHITFQPYTAMSLSYFFSRSNAFLRN